MTDSGIAVGAWVFVNEHCEMTCSIEGAEAHLEFGRDPAELQLEATAAGLVKILEMAGEALTRLRAADH